MYRALKYAGIKLKMKAACTKNPPFIRTHCRFYMRSKHKNASHYDNKVMITAHVGFTIYHTFSDFFVINHKNHPETTEFQSNVDQET